MTPADLEALFRLKGALVFRRCNVILKNESAAQDALQDVFLKVWLHRTDFENRGVPLSWLYRTAERCCFDLMRKQKKDRQTTQDHVDELSDPKIKTNTYDQLELILKFFEKLDDKLKQVALLHYLDELTQERIAEELGWSRRTVGKKLTQLFRMVERFQTHL